MGADRSPIDPTNPRLSRRKNLPQCARFRIKSAADVKVRSRHTQRCRHFQCPALGILEGDRPKLAIRNRITDRLNHRLK